MPYVQRVPDHSEENSWQVVNNDAARGLLSNDAYLTYARILAEYCSDPIDADRWNIPFTDGLRCAMISFENLSVAEEEKKLIKAYTINTLALLSSPSTCASKLKSLAFLFSFLHEKGLRVTALSTPVINLFRLWLDEIESLSTDRKNLIEGDLRGLIAFLREHNLLCPGVLAIPRPRVTPFGEVKRAPDRCTLARLDAFFFDFSSPIPSTYRCLYLLLRLIPCRNQEALSMTVDDFFVREDLLEVRIPTYKETANHRPIYQTHFRLAEEYPERLLLRSLREQKEYVLQQENIEETRLMLSPRNPQRVVTSSEFNAYLEDICEELGVTDAYGEPTRITMYSLRHANGAELARSTEIDRREFSRVFAHNSQYSDNGYGYASKHDELQDTAPFTQQVREKLSARDSSLAQVITPMRMARLQKELDTHLIGVQSLCREKGCAPQFIRCVFCEAYKSDPHFIPEAERCCEILRQRIERCKMAEDEANLMFNEKQLAAYEQFIRRAEEGWEVDEWRADL